MAGSSKGLSPKEKLEAFFNAATAARKETRSDIAAILGANRYCMHNGVFFEATDDFSLSLRDVVASVVKSEGPNKVNAKQVQQIAFDIAIGASPNKVKDFQTAIKNEVAKPYERIEPCFAVVLNEVSRLKIGHITVEDATEVASQLNPRDSRWRIEPGVEPSSEFKDNTFVIGMPRAVWRVQVACFKGNVREEAAWAIDVALSLLRLSIPQSRRPGNFPRIGSIEAAPTVSPHRNDYGISLHSTTASFGGSGLDGWYEISPKTFSKKKLAALDAIASSIMQPSKGSVAERVANGLGWLTRGRRASDQAVRFLNFFTAIESLLTRNDKNAPVTDTICRSVACILAAKIRDRAKIAKDMSDLYSTRSVLVHAGERRVSEAESTRLQICAELVFKRVLDIVPLTKPLDVFHAELKTASYGSAWP